VNNPDEYIGGKRARRTSPPLLTVSPPQLPHQVPRDIGKKSSPVAAKPLFAQNALIINRRANCSASQRCVPNKRASATKTRWLRFLHELESLL
jgi:hypothetical protein